MGLQYFGAAAQARSTSLSLRDAAQASIPPSRVIQVEKAPENFLL